MKHLAILLLLCSCKPKYVIDPVYNCTCLTQMQQEDMNALLKDCNSWECEQKVMQLYCEERKP